MALFILSSILFLFPILLQFFQTLTLPEDSFDIDIFILDVYEELNKEDYHIKKQSAQEFILESKFTTVSYRLLDKRLIKSINNKGFITLMYDVETFLLLEDKEQVTLNIGGQDKYQTLTFKK